MADSSNDVPKKKVDLKTMRALLKKYRTLQVFSVHYKILAHVLQISCY